jgi:hypothetical protein
MEKYNRASLRVSCLHDVQPDAPNTLPPYESSCRSSSPYLVGNLVTSLHKYSRSMSRSRLHLERQQFRPQCKQRMPKHQARGERYQHTRK